MEIENDQDNDFCENACPKITLRNKPKRNWSELCDSDNENDVSAKTVGETDIAINASENAEASEYSQSESQCCICLEPYTARGEHQTCCLKCGHLFGFKCISKWIREKSNRAGKVLAKCPSCNMPAKKQDVRLLFTTNLKALDNAQLASTMATLKQETSKRQFLEQELSSIQLARQALLAETYDLRRQVYELKGKLAASESSAGLPLPKESPFEKVWTANLCAGDSNTFGVARCLAYDESTSTLIVSKSFKEERRPLTFGFRLYSLNDPKLAESIPLVHTLLIRDIKAQNGFLLSASLDKSLALTDIGANRAGRGVVWRAQASVPIWSCCFFPADAQKVFAGLSDGRVALYDTRSSGCSQPVAVFSMDGSSTRGPSSGIQAIFALECVPGNSLLILGASLQQIGYWVLSEANDTQFSFLDLGDSNETMTCGLLAVQDNELFVQLRTQHGLLDEPEPEYTLNVCAKLLVDVSGCVLENKRFLKVQGQQARMVKSALLENAALLVNEKSELQMFSKLLFLDNLNLTVYNQSTPHWPDPVSVTSAADPVMAILKVYGNEKYTKTAILTEKRLFLYKIGHS